MRDAASRPVAQRWEEPARWGSQQSEKNRVRAGSLSRLLRLQSNRLRVRLLRRGLRPGKRRDQRLRHHNRRSQRRQCSHRLSRTWVGRRLCASWVDASADPESWHVD